MQFNFTMDSGDLLRRLSEQLSPEKMAEVAAAAVNEAILVGEQLVVDNTPVGMYETPDGMRRGGSMRGSIETELATPADPSGRIFTRHPHAASVEWGTGVHSEAPGAPRQPITIRAKNPRTITYTRNGRVITMTVVALVWYRVAMPGVEEGWRSAKEVTIQGQKPAAMFRLALPAIRTRLVTALQRRTQQALEGG
jgi:hypothetical protein